MVLRVSYVKAVAVCEDRKSTRLNSSHGSSSYAVFFLIKKMIEILLYERAPRDGRAVERVIALAGLAVDVGWLGRKCREWVLAHCTFGRLARPMTVASH